MNAGRHPRPERFEKDRRIAEAEVPKVAAAKEIVDYLNNLKANLFTSKVGANLDGAVKVASAMADKRQGILELTKLHRVATQPQPFYGPPSDPRTVRVFAKRTSIQSLKNEVKATLIDGWTTFDLKSAQLAIVAKEWGMTELHAWLSTPGNDIWKTLGDLYKTTPLKEIKPALKTAVYSICYGMDRENVISDLVDGFAELGHSPTESMMRATAFVDDAFIVPPSSIGR